MEPCCSKDVEGPFKFKSASGKCKQEGCNTQPVYNFKNETRGLYCFKHKIEGMIDIKSPRCQYKDCNI